jgi:hypothetical protein
MKRFIVLALILSVSTVAAFAAIKGPIPTKMKIESSPASPSRASSGDLEGKTAIGASGITALPGFGLRYWTSDKSAIDANIGFSSSKNNSQVGFGVSLDTIIKRTAYLKFMWFVGLQYISAESKQFTPTVTQSDLNIGLGLGVEYSFQEIPELSFDAFLTGIGIDMRNTSAAGTSVSDTLFATNPGLGFAIRYYIK